MGMLACRYHKARHQYLQGSLLDSNFLDYDAITVIEEDDCQYNHDNSECKPNNQTENISADSFVI